MTVNRLPLIVKDVTKKDEEMEIKQAEKKLKTAKTFNNNNLLTAEKTLTLAKALSRDQLLKLVSDLAEDPGRLASLLPRPGVKPHLPHAQPPPGGASHQAGSTFSRSVE